MVELYRAVIKIKYFNILTLSIKPWSKSPGGGPRENHSGNKYHVMLPDDSGVRAHWGSLVPSLGTKHKKYLCRVTDSVISENLAMKQRSPLLLRKFLPGSLAYTHFTIENAL